jgi:predicted MFS family arabinose efflux permease
MVNFAGGMPVLLLTLFAGVIIDRINKRRLLLATQAIQMCCALSLGILIKAGVVQIYHVLLVASVLGFAMAFDMPSRQSFVVELVGRKDLPSAVALNSSLFNAARSIGPAIAGLLLAAHVSLADCFLLNGFSYISVIIGLLLMRGKGLGDPKPAAMAEEQKMIENLKAGLDYVWNSHTVRNIVLLIGSFGTFAFSFNVLIPTFVRYTLLVNATNAEQVRAFGYLETWRGVGALCGAMSVVLFTSPERQKTMLMIGSLLATVLLIPFGLCHNITVAYVIMAVVSYAFVMCFSNANTLLQLTVPDHLRGRAMSIYMLMFVGTGPIGSLIAGYMAKYVGAPATIVTFAIISFVSALVICFRPGGIKDLVPPHLHARPVEVSAGK